MAQTRLKASEAADAVYERAEEKAAAAEEDKDQEAKDRRIAARDEVIDMIFQQEAGNSDHVVLNF